MENGRDEHAAEEREDGSALEVELAAFEEELAVDVANACDRSTSDDLGGERMGLQQCVVLGPCTSERPRLFSRRGGGGAEAALGQLLHLLRAHAHGDQGVHTQHGVPWQLDQMMGLNAGIFAAPYLIRIQDLSDYQPV